MGSRRAPNVHTHQTRAQTSAQSHVEAPRKNPAQHTFSLGSGPQSGRMVPSAAHGFRGMSLGALRAPQTDAPGVLDFAPPAAPTGGETLAQMHISYLLNPV